MAVAIAIHARESLRGAVLPLAASIGEGIGVTDVLNTIKRLKGFVSTEALEKLDKSFNEALRNEIHEVLNTDNLEQNFPMLVEKFWARIALPLIELSNTIYTLDAEDLRKFREVEEELARAVAKLLKNSNYNYADNLIYALSTLVDRDLWVLDKISELGFNALIKKIIDRALDVVLQFSGYTMYLTFAWVSSTAAVLGIARECKERNRDILAIWCQEYAKEINSYLDTLDLLLDDEVYEDLVELGIIRR